MASMGQELFPHIRVVMGIVLGLAVSKLLTGFASLVQHPGRYRLSAVHLLWAVSILIELILFWWWEFALSRIEIWNFGTFVFLIGYTVALFLLAALLFPDSIDEYGGYEAYFIRRRRWFFGLFAMTFVFDVIDTMIKGEAHWNRLSADYVVQVPVGIVLCIVACWSVKRRVHLALALLHLGYQGYWMARILGTHA